MTVFYQQSTTPVFCPEQKLLDETSKITQFDENAKVKFIDIPKIKLTEENYRNYGRVFKTRAEFDAAKLQLNTWPSPNGRPIIGGAAAGDTGVNPMTFAWSDDDDKRKLTSKNHGLVNEGSEDPYDLGFMDVKGNFYTRDSNNHPDGEQIFWPEEPSPLYLVLSSYRDEKTIKPDDFVAFWSDGTVGFSFYSYVQHNPMIMPTKSTDVITSQGKVHGAVLFDALLEYGCYLRIPNALSEPPTQTKLPAKFNTELYSKSYAPETKMAPKLSADWLKTAPATYYKSVAVNGVVLLSREQAAHHKVKIATWPSVIRTVQFGNEQGTVKKHISVGMGEVDAQYTQADAYSVKDLYARPDGDFMLMPVSDKVSYKMLIMACDSNSSEPDMTTAFLIPVEAGKAIYLSAMTWFSMPMLDDDDTIAEFVSTGNACEAYMKIDVLQETGSAIMLQS